MQQQEYHHNPQNTNSEVLHIFQNSNTRGPWWRGYACQKPSDVRHSCTGLASQNSGLFEGKQPPPGRFMSLWTRWTRAETQIFLCRHTRVSENFSELEYPLRLTLIDI